MKLLQYSLGFLFAFALTSTVVLFIANHFIDDSYFYTTADESSLNQAVSDVITQRLTEIDQLNSGVSNRVLDETLSSSVAQQYLESKNRDITQQLEAVLRGKKDTIAVEFSDLADISQSAGLDVTAVDIAPLEITPPESVTQRTDFFLQRIQFFLFITAVITILLFISSIVAAIKSNSHGPLLLSLLLSSILLGGISLIVGRLTVGTDTNFGLPETLQSLQMPLYNFIQYVKDDVQRWHASIAGGIFIATSLLGSVEYGILQRNGRRRNHRM